MEDLTAGQAAQLARNEQIIDKASEEFEDLEEMLNESIAESLRGKRGKLEAEASKKRRYRSARTLRCSKIVNAVVAGDRKADSERLCPNRK